MSIAPLDLALYGSIGRLDGRPVEEMPLRACSNVA
jgi:hypothetical protein